MKGTARASLRCFTVRERFTCFELWRLEALNLNFWRSEVLRGQNRFESFSRHVEPRRMVERPCDSWRHAAFFSSRKLTLPRYRWNASHAARLGPQALGTLMRFPPAFIFVIATVGGYFVSVPLFRHTYGILPDGTTTHILRQKDADRCKAQFMKSTATAPPIPSEPHEVPAQEIAPAQPVCDFRPPKLSFGTGFICHEPWPATLRKAKSRPCPWMQSGALSRRRTPGKSRPGPHWSPLFSFYLSSWVLSQDDAGT